MEKLSQHPLNQPSTSTTKQSEKGYFHKTAATDNSKRNHVEANGNVSLCARQDVEKERLMKSFQEVVQTAENSFHNSENKKLKHWHQSFSLQKTQFINCVC